MHILLGVLFALYFFAPLEANAAWDNSIDLKAQPEAYWQKRLSSKELHICRKKGTEPPYSGKYDGFYEPGTYVCACCCCDFSLFSSDAKYDSKTGWPSFWKPIDTSHIEIVKSTFSFIFGTEVLCARCGSHLGHVFNDGPPPTGQRYCINSIALKFIPANES